MLVECKPGLASEDRMAWASDSQLPCGVVTVMRCTAALQYVPQCIIDDAGRDLPAIGIVGVAIVGCALTGSCITGESVSALLF